MKWPRYEWDISELPGETAIFEVQKHGRASAKTLSYVRVSDISKWRLLSEVNMEWHISQLVCEMATKFQRLYLFFRCQATRMDCSKHCRVSGWVRNQRWRPITGSDCGTTYISACMLDSNDIPTAIPMFSMSSNTISTGLF